MRASTKLIVATLSVAVVSAVVWALFSSNPPATVTQPVGVSQPATAPAAEKPSLHFTCMSEGLPNDGFWKSNPAFTFQNGQIQIASSSRQSNGASVWRSSEGKWTEVHQGIGPKESCGGSVAFGDVNKDGNPDIVVADECSGVSVYLGDGNGHWKQAITKLRPAPAPKKVESSEDEDDFLTGAESVAIGDVDEDGCPDLVVGAYDQGGITVYLGNCTGTEWKETHPDGLLNILIDESERGGWANRVILTDLNGDGHLDLVASHSSGPRAWLGDGKDNWTVYSNGLPNPTVNGLFRGLAVGDINGDGLPDIAVANMVNGPEVFLQKGDGVWEQMPDPLPSMKGGALDVALADLDGDGRPELIVTGRQTKDAGNAYGVYVCHSDGKGGWMEVKDTGLPERGLSVTWGVGAADVNNDGRPDLVLTTGGIVPQPVRPPGNDNTPAPSDELPLPRVQVWLNQGVK
jgi:hypothetical protein